MCHSTLGSRVKKKKKSIRVWGCGCRFGHGVEGLEVGGEALGGERFRVQD